MNQVQKSFMVYQDEGDGEVQYALPETVDTATVLGEFLQKRFSRQHR